MKPVERTPLSLAFEKEAQAALTALVHKYRKIPNSEMCGILAHMAGYVMSYAPPADQGAIREAIIANLDQAVMYHATVAGSS